jgi:hypothetical protein
MLKAIAHRHAIWASFEALLDGRHGCPDEAVDARDGPRRVLPAWARTAANQAVFTHTT